jgi:glucan 1,3-beta-glucosidase
MVSCSLFFFIPNSPSFGVFEYSFSHTHTPSAHPNYTVFAEEPRALSPRQHIAYVCQNEYRDAISCCYEHDFPHLAISKNRRPSSGVKRMVGEWSAAYDTLPVAMLNTIMDQIAETGIAPALDRKMSRARKDFLLNFVQAQMVAYEAADVGTSGAWFYWTLKMEGGAFSEWDFMRGLREGWIPQIPAPTVTSESLHGTCYDIIFRTDDSMDIIDVFPDPATLPKNNWQGVKLDDDVVVTHGDSLLHGGGRTSTVHHNNGFFHWFLFCTFLAFAAVSWRYYKRRNNKHQYSSIETTESTGLTV